jgi:succinoglycan biosynthesis protein ExoM
MAEIVVAIPTFRRPEGLRRLLQALSDLQTDRDLAIVVADNDAEKQEGVGVCRGVRSYRWPLDVIVVRERGIAQVRNALVAHALADGRTRFLAMLDDDEWPEPHWLAELLRVQQQTQAGVVRGSVLRDFEIAPPAWAREWEGIAPIRFATGYAGMIEGIGNVLIRRCCFEVLAQPWFDPQFGLTGGEDKDFFVRLRALGTQFERAPDAIAHEHVPASRVGLRWSLMRAYRTGNCDMRIALKYDRGPGAMLREVLKVLAAVIAFPLASIAFSMNPHRRLDGLRKLVRAAGKVGALVGHRYYEYAAHDRR